MLQNYISTVIQQTLGHTPTPQQKMVIDGLAAFVTGISDDSIFLLKGYAGTGKTTVIGALVKAFTQLEQRCVLMAPTGRAAKVLKSYTERDAVTVHKQIYRQKSATDNRMNFVLDRNVYVDTVFIVDEASMIGNESAEQSSFGTGRLLDDLIEYVYSGENCRLILVGDTAQLPPVGLNISPALDKRELETYGQIVHEYELTEVVRQASDSGILFNATMLRQQTGTFVSSYPKIQLQKFTDVERINGADLIEKISESYDRCGYDDVMIACRSNIRANRYNEGIRNQILGREEEITKGDLLMVVRNNYFWLEKTVESNTASTGSFIANGDIVKVQRISGYEELYGFRFANVCLEFLDNNLPEIDAKIMLDVLASDNASLSFDDQNKLYYAVAEDYQQYRTKREIYKRVRENPYFNALQVKFAYAVTCHKAQGGQWRHVFVDQGNITEEQLNSEYYRWLYTAITRATEKLYLVNFKDDFFE